MWKRFVCQVERAFSVCGTIEYMAPEIVEGGESGHDKVVCCFMFFYECERSLQWDCSFSPLSQSHGLVRSCIPGGGLVEFGCVDVRAFDWWITLHCWWRWKLSHWHCQVWIFLCYFLGFVCFAAIFKFQSFHSTDHICLSHPRRISKKDPPFPKDMGALAKDLIQRLLIKDPKTRLGSGPNGAENVKNHPFYQVTASLQRFISCHTTRKDITMSPLWLRNI